MAKRSVAPWLGALLATPAVTVSVEPSAARVLPVSPQVSAPTAERSALRAGLEALSLDEKLAIAGDRVGPDPLMLSAWTSSGTWGAAPRTNTDIPECHTPNGTSASGAKTKGGHRTSARSKTVLRTNTDIPECRGTGAATGANHLAQTTTCTTPHGTLYTASGAGAPKGGAIQRTSLEMAICRGPQALAACGTTQGRTAPRTNTDIPECRGPGGQKCGAAMTPPDGTRPH
jgi:hypothetical protein